MKGNFFLIIISILFFRCIQAFNVGNPSDPCLFQDGIFSNNEKNFSVRGSYLYNNIYKGRYQDKYLTIMSEPSDLKLLIIAGQLTFNFYNRVDIYGIAGTSDLQLDQMIYTSRKFAWATGLTALLYKHKRFHISLDGKYFRTEQEPKYFVIDKEIYYLRDTFKQIYKECQVSLALSYPTNLLIPYIGATYLYSTITPQPWGGFLLLPDGYELDFDTSPSENRKNWGMVVGVSIISDRKASLNLETRMFDQNAFSFMGTIRF